MLGLVLLIYAIGLIWAAKTIGILFSCGGDFYLSQVQESTMPGL